MNDGIWNMVSQAGAMEKAILVLLGILSVVLWAFVFLKFPELRRSKKNSQKFLDRFFAAESFADLKDLDDPKHDCVHVRVFRAALGALNGKKVAPPPGSRPPTDFRIQPANTSEEIILLNMQHTAQGYFLHLQKGVSAMATIGSTTPFIGLFGTVVGIMTTFFDLGGVKSPSMQVVAPGISGALVATAAGLAVAIPAVVACNTVNSAIEELREASNAFIEKMMALIRANTETGAKPAHATAHAPTARPSAPAKAPVMSRADDDDDDDDFEDDEDDEPELAAKPAAKPIKKPDPKGRA